MATTSAEALPERLFVERNRLRAGKRHSEHNRLLLGLCHISASL